MSWKDLDIKLKAELIKLGVLSGIRDINLIRLLYDDSNTPTLVIDLSYNETNVMPMLGIERIIHDYGIPEEEVNKANDIIQLIENEISLEEINNQLPVLFRLFKNGGKVYNPPFMQRILNNDNRSVADWENPNRTSTHKLSYALTDEGYIVYPEVQIVDGQIHDFTDPKYNHGKWDALDNAIRNSDTLRFSTEEQALRYTQEYKNKYPEYFKQFNKGGFISNNPTLALVGKVKKYSKGGYENPDEPPVSESTYVELPPLNIYELELLNYLLSNPTAEQEYFRNLAVLNMTAPQSNQGVVLTKEEQTLVDKALLGYNDFRYSHPWAEGLSYTPIIGDGMDLISLAGAVNNKDYMTAGLGLGMLALPNFIEKPIKNIYKTIKPWIPDYEVVKAIKDGRFMPFLLRQNSPHILKYYNFNKNVATPIVVEDMLKYNENHITPFSDNLEYPLIKFRKSILDVPKFKVKRIPTKKNMRAYYSSINDEIVFDPRLRKLGVQGLKGFIVPESIIDSLMQTIFHEHFHGSTVNKPTIQSFNNDKYNGINNNNASAVRIFLPLVKNHGRWEGIPEEYIAELYGLDKVRQLTAPDMNDIDASNIIAKRLGEIFNIDPEDALWMIGELDRKGYKNGGYIFPKGVFLYGMEELDDFLNDPYVDTAVSLIPIVGTIKSAYDLYRDPSWQNLGDLGISILTEIPFLKAAKIAKAAKTTKAIKNSAKATTKAISRSKASINSPININRLLEHVNFVEKANKDLERYNRLKNLEQIGLASSIDGGYSYYKNFIEK